MSEQPYPSFCWFNEGFGSMPTGHWTWNGTGWEPTPPLMQDYETVVSAFGKVLTVEQKSD
jgi:hypothetical protein